MESNQTDSYGEWVIRKLEQEAGGDAHPFPAEVLAAARVVWPRIPTLVVASEIKPEGSIREAEALAAEIWEGVLRSVGRAIGRNGNYASSIRDPEAYLLVAFQHRFRRFQKAEHGRLDRFPSASTSLDLGLVEGARDATWIIELERAITVRQITDRMDAWTKKAWQARQFGHSWNRSVARGAEQAPAEASLEVSRYASQWDIQLPLGSADGPYDVKVTTAQGEQVLATQGVATIMGGITLLRVEVGLSSVRPGRYVLQVREPMLA